MQPLLTERLKIEQLTPDDAPFMLALLNDSDFIANIADRGVRNETEARQYIIDGPMASYSRRGYGMFAVRLLSSGELAGLCGLVKRPQLEDTDIGYAFLPAFRGRGLALEAARRVWRYATQELGLERIAGLVSPTNSASRQVLEKLGLCYERDIQLGPEERSVQLYLWQAGREKGA